MEDSEVLLARIKELSARCQNDSFITHTNFLSLSEQAIFFQMLKNEHIPLEKKKIGDVSYTLFGGHSDDDRKIIFFLPYYENEASLLESEKEGNVISCLHVYPKNIKYCDMLTHRDYLGALMHLGFNRNMFGDILTDGKEAYIFLLSSIAEQVKEELVKVKHTSIDSELIKPKDCLFSPHFIEKDINVSSNRLDCVISEVYHLSRRDSQVLIASENVFVNGMLNKNNSYELKPNERVSIAGKGKFIFLKIKSLSRKERLFISVKIYS